VSRGRRAAGQDPHWEHGQLYLPWVPSTRTKVTGGQGATLMAHGASGSQARASGERSGQTDLVHCETHHWWFGYAHYAADPADHPMVGKLGPNALDLSLEEFRALLKGRRGAIKTFLLDQDRIAGIGNVYVQTLRGRPRSTRCGRSRR
jgi:hypothetical protein